MHKKVSVFQSFSIESIILNENKSKLSLILGSDAISKFLRIVSLSAEMFSFLILGLADHQPALHSGQVTSSETRSFVTEMRNVHYGKMRFAPDNIKPTVIPVLLPTRTSQDV